MNALDERDDQDEPRSAGWAFDLAKLEHDCALVLLDDVEKSMVSPFWLESRRPP